MEQNQDQSVNQRTLGASGIATRVLAVFGFIAILGIGMWGSIKIASGVPGAFSSLASAFVSLTSVFVPANEVITVSTSSLTVQSGVPFSLSWTHAKQAAEGSYTFRYDCADGVYFDSPTPSGTGATVYCNVPFNFVNANNSISLTPVSTKNRFVDVAVYVDFTPNGASKAIVTGKTVLTIENDSLGTSPATGTTPTQTTTQTTTTPTPTITPTTPATRPVTHVTPTPGQTTTQTFPVSGTGIVQTSNPNGSVDLVARVIEVGVINKTTGAFTASSTPSLKAMGDQYRIGVRFAVENDGTKTSPQFDFNAVLPTLPSYIFSAPMQQALTPGDRIEFTLAFDSFDNSSAHIFTVNVDPSSRINESTKANNIVHYAITTSP